MENVLQQKQKAASCLTEYSSHCLPRYQFEEKQRSLEPNLVYGKLHFGWHGSSTPKSETSGMSDVAGAACGDMHFS
jgi:hypothetical protein